MDVGFHRGDAVMSVQVAPSLLSADFGRLEGEIAMVEAAGADLLHLDVMDAHFVPNLTFGPLIVEAVTRLTTLPRDTHLMITDPDRYLDPFVEAGVSTFTFHLEAFGEEEREARADSILERLATAGVGRGLALNPETPVEWVYPWLDRLETVLIMTVHPGFGGQKLIAESLARVPLLREEIDRQGVTVTIGVDGGVTTGNAAEVVAAGADILVAGSAVFGADDPAAAITAIRGA